MTDRELMQQALDALQESKPIDINDPAAFYRNAHAIEALRTQLAQPEQDDGYCQACEGNHCTANDGCVARDNPPPQREWRGLTDDEAIELLPAFGCEYEVDIEMILAFAENINNKLKEKKQ